MDIASKQNTLPSIFLKQEDSIVILNHLVELKDELREFVNTEYENVALCFLVDATGSMEPYVEQVEAQIENICSKIKKNMSKKQQILVSMVAYRDRKDTKPTEKINFTESMDNFKQFVLGLEFSGGGDACEDIKAGFEEVLQLDWSPSDLNLLVWIADSPCHGKKYHASSLSDDFPDENQEIEDYLRKFSEKNIDIYFYKTTNATDLMIKIFKEKSFIYDKFLREQKFENKHLTHRVVGNHSSSKSLQVFSQFFQFIKKFEKTKQLQRCQKLKQINKRYIQLQLSQNFDTESSTESNTLREKKDLDVIQESDIENIDDIRWKEPSQFLIYKLKLNVLNPNKIDVLEQEEKEILLSKDIIGQGSFKECYLGQDEQRGTFYAMKRFKEQTALDLDNLIIENVVHLVATKIRDSFLKQLKQNSKDEVDDKKKDKNLKLFFDDLFIAYDKKHEQFYLMDTAKYGFLKFINNDSNSVANINDPQSELFQSFIHYSFEYSGYSFILADIQGFGSILNDISLHSQNLIDNYQNVSEQQLKNQFIQSKKFNLENIKINTQINSNLGDIGIVLFFNRHKCNQYCKTLKLKAIYDIEVLIKYSSQRSGRTKEQSPDKRIRNLSGSLSAKSRLSELETICLSSSLNKR